MDIAELEAKYLTASADSALPGTVTMLIDGQEFCAALDKALASVGRDSHPAKNAGDFIYIANWWLGLVGGRYVPAGQWGQGTSGGPHVEAWTPGTPGDPPFSLDGLGGTGLGKVLKDKARAGVDVRVMGWVNFGVMSNTFAQGSGAGAFARVPALTMASIADLRAEPAIGDKAILNIISHTGGAAHAKIVIMGGLTGATAFTGGLDLAPGRWARKGHFGDEVWHDVAAQIEGPAVQPVADWFFDFWNENVFKPDGSRREGRQFAWEGGMMPHILPGTPTLPRRALTLPAGGEHRIQSLRTLPQQNYSFFSIAPAADPLSFAPEGLEEVKNAWSHAIANAESYIYIEDQAFWSQEVLQWVGKRMKKQPTLHVILVSGGRADPNDPQFPGDDVLCQSINHGLLEDGDATRVRMFNLWGDTQRKPLRIEAVTPGTGETSKVRTGETFSRLPQPIPKDHFANGTVWVGADLDNYPVVGSDAVPITGGQLVLTVKIPLSAPSLTPRPDGEMVVARGLTVHSKLTIIDDNWLLVGSANCMRRSLYTDCEHSVGVVDEHDALVKEFRKQLWAEHFHRSDPGDFDDLDASLNGWESSWGTAGSGPPRPSRGASDPAPPWIEPVPLPLKRGKYPMPAGTQRYYDVLMDSDSRQDWGFILQPRPDS